MLQLDIVFFALGMMVCLEGPQFVVMIPTLTNFPLHVSAPFLSNRIPHPLLLPH